MKYQPDLPESRPSATPPTTSCGAASCAPAPRLPAAHRPLASLAVLLRGRPAIRSLSGTRHDSASTECGLRSQRARLAVEAAVPRSAVPPDRRTGPLPAPRRDR